MTDLSIINTDLSFVNKDLVDAAGIFIEKYFYLIAFLIFLTGVSFRIDKVLNAIRLYFKEKRAHTIKLKELNYRIQRDAHIIGIEIDKKKKTRVVQSQKVVK